MSLLAGELTVVALVFVIGCADSAKRPLTGSIAFSSDSRGDDNFADVFGAAANGNRTRQLTRRAGPEFDPGWSPDGSRLVYHDSRRGINASDEIYVMDAHGRKSKSISRNGANDCSPARSPSRHNTAAWTSGGCGRTVAYIKYDKRATLSVPTISILAGVRTSQARRP